MRTESKKIYDEIVKNLTEQGINEDNFRKALESVDYRINMETDLDQHDAIEDSLEATYKLMQHAEETTGEPFQSILDRYNTTDPDALGDEVCQMFVDICNAHEGEEAYDYFCDTVMYSDIVDYLAEDGEEKTDGDSETLNESSENLWWNKYYDRIYMSTEELKQCGFEGTYKDIVDCKEDYQESLGGYCALYLGEDDRLYYDDRMGTRDEVTEQDVLDQIAHAESRKREEEADDEPTSDESQGNGNDLAEFKFSYKFWGRDGVGKDRMIIYAPDLRTALFLYDFHCACDLGELDNLGVDNVVNDILVDIYRGRGLKKNVAKNVNWDKVSALMKTWGKDPATELKDFLKEDAEGGGDSMAVTVRQGSKRVFDYDVDDEDADEW